jgi:hypothetical protein
MFFVFTSGGLFAFNGNERFKIVGDDADGGNERFGDKVIVLVGEDSIGI